MRPEVPSRARRLLPALHRREKEDGRRPSEFLVLQICLSIKDNANIKYKYGRKLLDSANIFLETVKVYVGQFKYNEKFGWPTAILFLAPAEGWKGPSGPAGNLWPHLIYSSLERFRKKSDRQTHRRTHEVTHTQMHPRSDTHTDAPTK